jgi:hypothetical protein
LSISAKKKTFIEGVQQNLFSPSAGLLAANAKKLPPIASSEFILILILILHGLFYPQLKG